VSDEPVRAAFDECSGWERPREDGERATLSQEPHPAGHQGNPAEQCDGPEVPQERDGSGLHAVVQRRAPRLEPDREDEQALQHDPALATRSERGQPSPVSTHIAIVRRARPAGSTATVLRDGTVLVVGGFSGLADVDLYTPGG
jgi:hypothetical protein